MIIHSKTYEYKGLGNYVHRSRLNNIIKYYTYLFNSFQNKKIIVADVGCSDGFILKKLEENIKQFSKIKKCGFDHSRDLIKIAKKRDLKNTTFLLVDLNKKMDINTKFDIVSCFETLEHTGDYKTAVDNLFRLTSKNGFLFLTMPIETGLKGLFKFLVRYKRGREVYGNFFRGKSKLGYILWLLLHKDMEKFRQEKENYGPHLGFDFRNVINYITKRYIKNKKLKIVLVKKVGLRLNYMIILKRIA